MFITIPSDVSVTSMLEPPALINGSALPVKGNSPTITAIFIKASIPIQEVSPKAIIEPSWSGAFLAITNPRQTSRTNIAARNSPPIIPVSSATTAKMLSVGARGRPVNLVSA